MPPKVKVTRDEIIRAATALVKASGLQGINARAIAALLNCSTQPVFSNFATMEEVLSAVVKEAEALCADYIRRETESGLFPAYKASGIAYIRFAKEEKELFKLLYMRDRRNEGEADGETLFSQMEALIQKNTALDAAAAKLFHLEMWAYVHGIAAMFATDFLDLDWELVSRMLTDCYQGLLKQYRQE